MIQQILISHYLKERAKTLPSTKRIGAKITPNLKLSVVVPAFNEEHFIEKLLLSLNKQTVSAVFEAIVVDNGSLDNTVQIVKKFQKIVHYPLYLLSETLAGAGNARKTGIDEVLRRVSESKRDSDYLVAITDADVIVPSNWIETILITFSDDPSVNLISGNYRGATWIDRAIKEKTGINNYFTFPCYLSGYLENIFGQRRMRGPNSAFTLSAYIAAGGFQQPYNSDNTVAPRECYDFALRARRAGFQMTRFKTIVIASQRRHLYELLRQKDSYSAICGNRFIPVRYDEEQLLAEALIKVPLQKWEEYQQKVIDKILDNVLFNPIKNKEINPNYLSRLLKEKTGLFLKAMQYYLKIHFYPNLG